MDKRTSSHTKSYDECTTRFTEISSADFYRLSHATSGKWESLRRRAGAGTWEKVGTEIWYEGKAVTRASKYVKGGHDGKVTC